MLETIKVRPVNYSFMVDNRSHLRSMLSGESRAYGFTIAFWGSGAVLINSFGAPHILLALCFGFGAVMGFGLLALTTLKGEDPVDDNEDAMLVLSTIHYLSALGPMVVTHLLTGLDLSTWIIFLASGVSVSITHNLLSLLEYDIAKFLEARNLF